MLRLNPGVITSGIITCGNIGTMLGVGEEGRKRGHIFGMSMTSQIQLVYHSDTKKHVVFEFGFAG